MKKQRACAICKTTNPPEFQTDNSKGEWFIARKGSILWEDEETGQVVHAVINDQSDYVLEKGESLWCVDCATKHLKKIKKI